MGLCRVGGFLYSPLSPPHIVREFVKQKWVGGSEAPLFGLALSALLNSFAARS